MSCPALFHFRPSCFFASPWCVNMNVSGGVYGEVKMPEIEESNQMGFDVGAERPRDAVTGIGGDGSARAEWVGRCRVLWEEGDMSALLEVVVKLLPPGMCGGCGQGCWTSRRKMWETKRSNWGWGLAWHPHEQRAAARGLFEGGVVRVMEDASRDELLGRIAKLLRFLPPWSNWAAGNSRYPSWT